MGDSLPKRVKFGRLLDVCLHLSFSSTVSGSGRAPVSTGTVPTPVSVGTGHETPPGVRAPLQGSVGYVNKSVDGRGILLPVGCPVGDGARTG